MDGLKYPVHIDSEYNKLNGFRPNTEHIRKTTCP